MISKSWLLLLLVLLLGALCPRGGMAQEDASDPQSLVADLNGDGKRETISWRRLGGDTETGVFQQVVVRDASGAILWKSPQILDAGHPLAFGEWDFGVSLPQLAADVDGDGKVEMLVPAPQSDVSPTYFRVFRWSGSAFEPVQSRALTGAGKKGAIFGWTDSPPSSAYWVQQWLGASPEGGWVVELATLPESGEYRSATAVLVTKGEGFELIRWIRPPESPAAQAEAGEAVRYRARLSAADHVNSSGNALKKVIDILRQDRANYHRGTHRDAEDGGEDRFAAPEAREALAGLPVTVHGGGEAEAEIVGGTPVVDVTVAGGAVEVEIVKR